MLEAGLAQVKHPVNTAKARMRLLRLRWNYQFRNALAVLQLRHLSLYAQQGGTVRMQHPGALQSNNEQNIASG